VALSFAVALIPLVWVLWTVASSGFRTMAHASWWTDTQRNITYTDAGGGSIGYTLGASNQNHGLPDDNVPAVTNVDGSRVCVSLLSNQVACFNGADMSDRFVLPAAGSFINGVAMGSDGRIDFTPGAAGAGVSVYSASGVALTSIPGGAGQRGLVVSSDGFILGVASGPYDPAGQLVIAPVGP